MVKKLIACSFDSESMGGFITICNGVPFGREGHYSKTVAITKEGFLEASKDKLKFNDILGVNITQGWQNALSDAIECYKNMTDTFDPKQALKTSCEMDVKVRGEEAVIKDAEVVEKKNEALDKEIEKALKKQKKTKAKKETKVKKDVEQRDETVDNGSENARSEEDNGVSADGSGTECAE